MQTLRHKLTEAPPSVKGTEKTKSFHIVCAEQRNHTCTAKKVLILSVPGRRRGNGFNRHLGKQVVAVLVEQVDC